MRPRSLVPFMVGLLLAFGLFDHVVVSVLLHLLFGVWECDVVGYGGVAVNVGLAATATFLGGLLLITVTRSAQVES